MQTASVIPGPLLALVAFVIYTGGMALAWKLSPYDYETQTPQLLRSIIPALLVLVALMWGLVWWSGLDVVGDLAVVSPWVWLGLVPPVISLAGLATGMVTDRVKAPDWRLFAVVMAATMLVGIGEETAFRGLAFNGLAQQFSIPIAIVLSSVLFGLLHSVNFLAGLKPSAAATQVVITAVLGTIIAWVYVLSGRNLVLVMVWHFFYDFALISPMVVTGKPNRLGPLAAVVGLMILVVLTVVGIRAL